MKLNRNFFDDNAVTVAKELIGNYLINETNEGRVVAKIVETEAYSGMDDLACHASHGKTERTKIMFDEAGHLYIYLNYGIFYMTNIVCGQKDFPAAILLRAAEIIKGHDVVIKRLEKSKYVKANRYLATGPGKLSLAFGITKKYNCLDITKSNNIYIEKAKNKLSKSDIIETKRIGVDYAKHCKDYQWRFYYKNNQFVSKNKFNL